MGTPVNRTQLVTSPPAASTGEGGVAAIPLAQKGAANGVTELDSSGLIPVARVRMATETRTRLNALDAAVAAIDGPEEGDGIRVVGDVVNVDITKLTLAP